MSTRFQTASGRAGAPMANSLDGVTLKGVMDFGWHCMRMVELLRWDQRYKAKPTVSGNLVTPTERSQEKVALSAGVG